MRRPGRAVDTVGCRHLPKPLYSLGGFVNSSPLLRGAAALILGAVPSVALAQAEKPGSAYVQCDGQPDNVSDGETAARLLGAVTLLGLFAPPHESPDASKRKFGADGVAACNSLLSGQESNAKRRLGLILGRSIHQIEAKNYQAAIDDVALARREAEAAGFMSDPYFVRSRARAFDEIESAALLRMGRAEDARAASLRGVAASRYSFVPLFSMPTYGEFIATPSATEEQVNGWRVRLAPAVGSSGANRLDLARRFAESARLRDALVEFDAEHTPELNSSVLLARSALAHALAGDFAVAADRAKAARANADKRKLDGKPESDAAELVELLDLYAIVDTARTDAKAARRLFAARSQWLSVSLGSVLEVNRRLREGAAPDELIGGLARDPDALWKEHVDAARAALLAKDSDNKTLFTMIPWERSARSYDAVARNVWRTDKSKIIIVPKKLDPAKERLELMFLYGVDPAVALDAYVLHAALIARSRGHQGFVFAPLLSDKLIAGTFRTGNRGDKGFPPELFIDANDAIATLSAVIPDPATRVSQR